MGAGAAAVAGPGLGAGAGAAAGGGGPGAGGGLGGGMSGLASTANGPGGFSSSLRSVSTVVASSGGPSFAAAMAPAASEALVEELQDQLNKALKYQEGAENYLQVFEKDPKRAKEAKKARIEAEKEYNERTREITQLQSQIAAITKPRETPVLPRVIETFQDQPLPLILNGLSPIGGPADMSAPESPTVSLTDVLRELEEKDNRNEYYVDRANQLVALFKRHPNLKHELNWDTFGHRLHSMLLHESKEVVAAGYRVTRYALTDAQSLKTIRSLHIDHLVVLSLVSRSSVEREQALKFVRAFLEIPGGVAEISRAVVRAIVACAEQTDDRLRGIAMETLAEILVFDPALVVSAGGIRVLTQVLGDGPWEIADALSLAFLYLLDMPETRKYVRAGHDLEVGLTIFVSSPRADLFVDRLLRFHRFVCSRIKDPV